MPLAWPVGSSATLLRCVMPIDAVAEMKWNPVGFSVHRYRCLAHHTDINTCNYICRYFWRTLRY